MKRRDTIALCNPYVQFQSLRDVILLKRPLLRRNINEAPSTKSFKVLVV